MRLAEIEELRRTLIDEETVPTGVPEPQATVDQLFEIDQPLRRRRRRPLVHRPGRGRAAAPAVACSATGGSARSRTSAPATDSRERGYAKAIVLAAVAAAQADGDAPIFLTAEAADWPQLMYAKLGFETVGDLTILRRRP